VAPSPTADATRLTERQRPSPRANTLGTLVSKTRGSLLCSLLSRWYPQTVIQSHSEDLMRIATLADVDLIKNILLVSFKNDPHVNWLLEESKNKSKLNILIDYVVHQTLRKGEIYLSDDNNAVALWDFERNEKLSFHYIWRNLAFLIQIGIKSVVRIVKSEAYVHNNFRKYPRFCHLYMIGVLPEAQGKGLASALMNPMIQSMKEKSIPLFLETANPRNVEIYKKKGFKIFQNLTIGDHNLFLMSTGS
jgi:ribosomal protein S18 acetylase RimI-like enzyme